MLWIFFHFEMQVFNFFLNSCRSYTSSPKRRLPHNIIPRRPDITLLESDLEESFIKGGGAGGQKINKTNSKVSSYPSLTPHQGPAFPSSKWVQYINATIQESSTQQTRGQTAVEIEAR
jgi:hypothetical protein